MDMKNFWNLKLQHSQEVSKIGYVSLLTVGTQDNRPLSLASHLRTAKHRSLKGCTQTAVSKPKWISGLALLNKDAYL